MKIGLAIQQVRSAESDLAEEFRKVGERHKTEHEVYHLTRTLADMSRDHIEELTRYEDRYRSSLFSDAGTSGGGSGLLDELREKGSSLLESVREEGSGLLEPVREKGSELVGRQPISGMLLLRDLRQLYRLASEVSVNWVILGQGAQVSRDGELLQTVKECHAQNLRQLKWANTMIKQISPQVLMN